jgi:hypothetical protein
MLILSPRDCKVDLIRDANVSFSRVHLFSTKRASQCIRLWQLQQLWILRRTHSSREERMG